MKIRVINSVSCMDRAGQETLLMNILRNINRNEFQYDFVCSKTKKGDYDEEIYQLGSNILYLEDKKWIKIKYLSHFNTMIKEYRFFRNHKEYHIYHIHNYHAFSSFLQIIGAKLAGVKNIYLHSHNTNAPHPKLHLLFRFLCNRLKINRLACSEAAARWMYGSKWKEARVIKNGIILDNFRYNSSWRELRKEFGVNDDTLLVGHVGRFNYQKNHKFLLEIFSKIVQKKSNSKMVLIGTGELEKEIKESILNLNLNDKVILAGSRSDVNKWLSCFDVMLFPSLHEGLSVVLVEAQAAGLPCVVSDTNSEEVILTEYIKFLSLELPADQWADEVLAESSRVRRSTTDDLRNKGYDIVETTHVLENMYRRCRLSL